MIAVNETALTPLSFLERSARVWSTKPAIVDGDITLTYAEFADSAQELAKALRMSGIAPGDRVAVLLPNVHEMLLAHFGVPLAGAVLVAINTRLSPEEVAYILDHSGSSILLVDSRFVDVARSAVAVQARDQNGNRPCQVIVTRMHDVPEPFTGWRAFVNRAKLADALPWTVPDERAPIAINYTSGTTGRPKGVVYTHRGAYLNAMGELLHSRHSPESVYLWTLPMFHCNGWCTPWAVTAIGGEHLCLPEVRADAIWRSIRGHGVTHLNAAPTVLTMMMNAPEAGHVDTPVTVTTAGAPPSPATIAQMKLLGFSLVHVYGLTETYGPYSISEIQPQWSTSTPEVRAQLQARQGVGMIQSERLRVVDEQMNDIPADAATMGEIVMRGNNVMAGYFRDPEGTEQAFKGGWFHSGDLGVMHPDGYVELRDRAKDVIVSGGENISTIEVEQALASHPAVLEAAVIGVPDDKWGERPKGFVIVKAGRIVLEDDLIEHVRSKIARYKAPREVVVVSALPKTSTGKIQKFVLRDAEWAGRDKQIQG
jgi:fatty-acyl-CoA synthase